ncbi:MAG: FliM/FliN family flagellar motor switch protein [SAR324 cluster bacterium]|nr:FliM/FliN family flagellar motor switch protein [SAR324 cluster bacterium]MBL7034900.1 FliM/FliN family flagellar motor switch protein [SAR324 cluster bacterium]
MAEDVDDFEVKLSEDDSPNDILNNSEDTELFDDNSSEDLIDADADDVQLDSVDIDSVSDDVEIDLGMDEIGDLVEDIKLDLQDDDETAIADEGEEDMVFDAEGIEDEGSDSVESLLDELGGDESDETTGLEDSTEDTVSGDEDSLPAVDEVTADEVTADEVTVDEDDPNAVENSESEELELSDDLDLSDNLDLADDAESSADANSEENEVEESSEVLEMLHDPEVNTEGEDSEATDSDNPDLAVDAVENNEEIEDTGIDFEDNDTEPSTAEETVDADTEAENEVESVVETEEITEPQDVNQQVGSRDSEKVIVETEETPVIEKAESKMPNEKEAIETSAPALGSEMLLNFNHQVVVEVARTQLTGEEITQITYGSVIELDKVSGEPVNLVLDGKTIALGEVVQINNEKLGIRIVGIVQE